jgi:VanZ family protein
MHATATPTFERQPDFLKRLGLAFPCSEEDVQQAYRQKVWQAHPDRGGDIQTFIALQEAYEQSLHYVRFQAGRRRWLAQSLEHYVEQQAAIAQIEHAGGRVEIESLDWFAGEVGEDFAQVLERVVGIELSGSQFNDALVEKLLAPTPLRTNVRRLNLSRSSVTSRGLSHVGRLPKLRELDVSDTSVGNRGLGAVNNFPDLERINLSGTRANLLGRLALAWSRPFLLVQHNHRGMQPTFRLLRRLTLTLLGTYLLLMFLATHLKLRDLRLPEQELPLDKLVHFAMYALLGFLAGAAVGLSRRVSALSGAKTPVVLVLVVIALAAWGFVDELTQPMFGRTFEWLDLLADVCGIIVGLGCFQLALRLIRRKIPTVWVVSKSQHDLVRHRRVLRETIEGLAVHSL